MSDEIKPCPFCGGEAKLIGEPKCYWINCQNSDCLTSSGINQKTEEEAIQYWNRRVDKSEPITMEKFLDLMYSTTGTQRLPGEESMVVGIFSPLLEAINTHFLGVVR
jgi:hypothetical protein